MSISALFCTLCLSSCYIGGGTVTFDTNGAGYTPMPISQNNGQTIDKLPIVSKIGYEFVGWCYDKDLTNLAYTPLTMGTKDFTLYAKYKIKEADFISESTIQWTENTPSITLYHDNPRYILLNMLPSLNSVNKISVLPYQSEYTCSSLKVFDYNGKEIPDKNPADEIWEAAEALSNVAADDATYRQYVLVIEHKIDHAGTAQIICENS